MKILLTSLFLVTVLLIGCSEPTVDATTDETMKTSIANVRETLSESKRAEYDEAVQLLVLSQISLKSLFAEGVAGMGNVKSKMKDAIHGKTAKQIIANANVIKLEREQKKKEQALQEIKELEGKKVLAEQAREELKKFEVLRSRFYKEKEKYTGYQPIIELTVKNGTTYPVSRAYFKGTIASPKRSVPWHEDTFNYSISGGLEPKEKAEWRLAPNMFSDWGKVDSPEDAIFTVVVERIDGADGKAILSVNEFGEREQKRLLELKEKYNIN
ncbi:Possible lipoprotein [uncultured Candidatus Thioglobus sp.]|nr:Possible lipoprotein [uncultured Candidatus Thioglobus sp.]